MAVDFVSQQVTGRVIRARTRGMSEEVKAHITGTVWKIEKKVGDKVNEGDVLVILESMKMEMPIEAPVSGTITKVTVNEAQPVNEGDVVVVID